MEASLIVYDGTSVAQGELESELPSRQLGVRGGSGTPKFDATPSPFVVTPSAPQRPGRACQQRGRPTYCPDDSASTPRIHKTSAAGDARREGDGIDSINKDLLVISLEEENDRLRGALESERRARQLAEARAREFEQQAVGLASRLAEAQHMLEELEQEAYRRVMVQAWLDTSTPQRRGSMDPCPEASTDTGRAVFAEARPRTKQAVSTQVIGPTGASKPGAAPSELPGSLATSAACGAEAEVEAGSTVGDVRVVACRTHSDDEACLDLEYGTDSDQLDLCRRAPAPAPPPCAGPAGAPGCGCFGGAIIPTAGCWAGVPRVGHCRGDEGAADVGNLQLAWTAACPLQRACTLAGDRSLFVGADAQGFPLQGQKHRATAALSSPGGRPPRQAPPPPPPPPPQQQQQQPGGRLRTTPLGCGDGEPHAVGVGSTDAVAVTAAANIWMPAGAALCNDWGLDPAPGGAQPPSAQLRAGYPGRVAAAAPLAATWSLPSGGLHLYPYPHAPHAQVPPPWLGPLRVPDQSKLKGSSAILRSAFTVAAVGGGAGFGGGGGGAYDRAIDGGGAAIHSCGSAPVGAQDGGEWCNIPLSSPACTPNEVALGPRAGTP